MSAHTPSPWQFEQAMSVLLAVRRRLIDDDPDIASDERLMIDLLDGEGGNAIDVIDDVIRASVHATNMAQAAKDYADRIGERAKRYKARAENLRGAAFAALSALEIKRHERADFTASIGTGQQSVIITDKAALDRKYIRVTETEDKASIGADLKAGIAVDGAELSNGTPTLTIRTR